MSSLHLEERKEGEETAFSFFPLLYYFHFPVVLLLGGGDSSQQKQPNSDGDDDLSLYSFAPLSFLLFFFF